ERGWTRRDDTEKHRAGQRVEERLRMDVRLRLPTTDGALDEQREVGARGCLEPGREAVPEARIVTDVDHEAGDGRHDLGPREELDRVPRETAEIPREVPGVPDAQRQVARGIDGGVHQLRLGPPAPVDRRAIHAG